MKRIAVLSAVLTCLALTACDDSRERAEVTSAGVHMITAYIHQDAAFTPSAFGGNAELRLGQGFLLRMCRDQPGQTPDANCRYFVPAPPVVGTRTVYDPGGYREYLKRWDHEDPRFYLSHNRSFRVCRMPVVEHPDILPSCETTHP